MRVKRFEVGGVRRVNGQCNLEDLPRPPRQRDDLSKFMHFQAIGLAVVNDRSERPAPGSHCRESAVILRRVHRPLVEDREPSGRTPLNTARWDRTCRGADVFADREVQIVRPRRNRLDALLVPELREAGIFVKVGEPAHPAQHRLQRQMARNVDQQLGAAGGSQHIVVRDAVCLRPLVAQETRGSLEPELADDAVEKADVGRLFEARRLAGVVDARSRCDLLDEENGAPEPAEAEHPVQAHPGLAPVQVLVRQRAGDENGYSIHYVKEKYHVRLVIAALVVASQASGGQGIASRRPVDAIRRVVVVSIDGLRPDLLQMGRNPNMRALIERGSFTFRARTVTEGYTVPSHVSMLTGVVPSRHGVTWDRHIEDSYPHVPTLFELAKKAGYTTALAAGKTKLIVLTKPGTLDWSYLANEDTSVDLDVARRAVAMIRDYRPDVLFVHFGQVDVAGHASGWGSAAQLNALEKADEAFGLVLRAVAARGLTNSTATVLTADHGGAGRLHRPEDSRSQFIPWVVAGPSIRRNFDLGAVPNLTIDTMSTFATVCALLGIVPAQAIDGKPVMQILNPSPRR